jgi:acyl-CoA reductase-like NAD-dependent aldehyde dehydrogenase
MSESQTIDAVDIAALAALAHGIIPGDSRDGGAAAVNAGPRLAEKVAAGVNAATYRRGLAAALSIAKEEFGLLVGVLDAPQVHWLLDALRPREAAFFRQLRMDVCALYLGDADVAARIGFPGASTATGGYPDFDQPQKRVFVRVQEKTMNVPTPLAVVTEFLSKPRKMLIGGEWVSAASGESIETPDPATGRALGRYPAGDARDVDAAVAAARRAFHGPWRKITPYERGRLLQRAAGLIEKHAEELAQLITLDNGKPLWEAKKEVATAVSWTEYYAGWTTKLTSETIPVSLPGSFLNYTVREPIGVVAGITPPNYPLTMPLYKMAPALATGNVIIIKPAEQTSLVALRLGELFQEAGFPEGVVNIVTGLGETAGAALAGHDGVDKITFTGSTEVGRLILKAAAGNLKKVSLELGGKSPNIVFADADIEAALKGAFMGIFFCQGEICSAGSRLFVQESIYETFVSRLAEMARGVRLGHGLDPETKMGPLVSGEQQERVLQCIAAGVREGAKPIIGGKAPGGPLAGGCYVEPTIFTGVKNEMTLARTDIFGPVICAMPFKDLPDAIARGNDSPYGLAAGVWTNDLRKAHQVAAELRTGTVWVNCYNAFDNASPWGGYKQSGWGREKGPYGLDLFTELKSVVVNYA